MANMNYVKIPPFLALMLLGLSSFGQNWTNVFQLGGMGNETCQSLEITKDGELLVAGTYNRDWSFDTQEFKTVGEGDIYLVKVGESGSLAWGISFGSILDDQVSELIINDDGSILIGGSYWFEIQIGEILLQADGNSKALFLAKIDADGEVLWAKTITGSTLKDLEDIALDKDDNIYICGFFEDQLSIEGQTLFAKGTSDLFIAQFDANGDYVWANHEGYRGDTRAVGIAVTSERAVLVAGTYSDTTIIGQDTLLANTTDLDAFVSRFDSTGQAEWAKRAGGVFDDVVIEVALDEEDHFYISGHLVGVMTLSDNISIQSTNGNPDPYLLKYDKNGNPLWAKTLAGPNPVLNTDLSVKGDLITLSGSFSGTLTNQEVTISSLDFFSGFTAAYDANGNNRWLYKIHSQLNTFADQAVVNNNTTVWLAGSFEGQLDETISDETISSNGGFDVFVALLDQTTSTLNPMEEEEYFVKVFPDPTKDWLNIKTNLENYNIALVDSLGHLVVHGKNLSKINVQNFPAGIYYLRIDTQKVHKSIPVKVE